MLKLILSKDWTAGRDEILRRIANDVRNGKGGRILMVPELISHDMERRLCEHAGDHASRYAEVLSFTRLARRVADQMGSAARECLDDGGRVVAMASATRNLHSKLKAYASVETKPEFLTDLVNAVDEFKRCCISSQDLMAASTQTEGSFSQKLEELALILEAYDSLCARGKRDPRDQMNWLLEQLEEGNFAQNHCFYIDGFPDFTRQHMAILEFLIVASDDVTVSLTCDCVGSSRMAFEKAGSTAQALVDCAQKAGVKVQIQIVESDRKKLMAARELLFQGTMVSHPETSGILHLYRTETVYQECMAAAQQVIELVQNGCRYRDIGIVCTDMNAYKNLLSMVFNRAGIPVYLSGTEDILSKTVISTVLSALDAALGGFEQQDVLRYLKSPLCNIDMESCDKLENYVLLWNISGRKWLQPWENHPVGLGEEWTDGARRKLNALNETRETALAPLHRLSEGFRSGRMLKDQIMTLYCFLEDIQLAATLNDLADLLDRKGDNRSAQILNQLWDILLSAMEQMYDVLGETIWDSQTFTRLFTLLLSQYHVGTIPPVLDSVTVGPVSAMRCQQTKHLIVLGAMEGCLPGYGGTNGVLSDQERVALRQLGVPLTGGNMEGLQAEFAEIYGVFCGADETVSVFCPAGEPSYVYRRLAQLAGGDASYPLQEAVLLSAPEDAGAYFARYRAAEEARKLGLHLHYNDALQRANYQLGMVTADHVCGLYGSNLILSASQIDRQADCRFSYFLRYGLRAKERKPAEVDPAEFGTYVHAVLENTAKRVMELGGFHVVSLEDTMAIAREYSDAYARERFHEIDSARINYLMQRNVAELEMIVRELWQELHTSLFAPVGFEVGFGEGKSMPAVPIDGTLMHAQLRGFVDRVDSWKGSGNNYFRVVDYKTGRKDFDYCDVFNGLGLQMLLYMFALEQGGDRVIGAHPIPAGVQYFSARSPLLSTAGRLSDGDALLERGKKWKRKGLVLLNDDVLNAMEPEGSLPRLSCKRNKDGELSGDLADREQFRMLRSYLFRLLGSMVDEIASGKVEPNPYTRGKAHNACTYCPYQAICHAETVLGRRNYKSMSAEEFWQSIRKELNKNGG